MGRPLLDQRPNACGNISLPRTNLDFTVNYGLLEIVIHPYLHIRYLKGQEEDLKKREEQGLMETSQWGPTAVIDV